MTLHMFFNYHIEKPKEPVLVDSCRHCGGDKLGGNMGGGHSELSCNLCSNNYSEEEATRINNRIMENYNKEMKEYESDCEELQNEKIKFIPTLKKMLNSKKQCYEIIKCYSYALKYVSKQTEEICLLAVKNNGRMLEYVKNQTDIICLAAVCQDSYALKYVSKQTEEICLLAVKNNGRMLEYVKNKTDIICLAAVYQNFFSLEFVDEQTLDVYFLSIKAFYERLNYKHDNEKIKYLHDQGMLNYIHDKKMFNIALKQFDKNKEKRGTVYNQAVDFLLFGKNSSPAK